MTYIAGPQKYDFNTILLKDMSATMTAGNTIIPSNSENFAGTPVTTFNTSTGVISLPNRPCILTAGLMFYETGGYANNYRFIEYQWYDVTNSSYIGNKARIVGESVTRYLNNITQGFDESAIAIGQNISVKLVLTALGNTSSPVIDGTGAQDDYAGRSHILIHEF